MVVAVKFGIENIPVTGIRVAVWLDILVAVILGIIEEINTGDRFL